MLNFMLNWKPRELPTSLPMGCTWATEWAAHGLPMGSLPCKLGCPILPYMEIVDSSVGSTLLQNMKKWAAQWAVEWAAHGNFAMQIRLPTSSIYVKNGQLSKQWSGQPVGYTWEFRLVNESAHYYGNGGQLCGQLSGQPTTSKYGNSSNSLGSPLSYPLSNKKI